MKKRNKQILFASLGTVLYAFFIGLSYKSFSPIFQVSLCASILALLAMFFYGIIFKKDKCYKLAIILVYFGLIAIVAVAAVMRSGILKDIKDPMAIAELIKASGNKGKLIFVLIQFLQVTFVPIPSTIITAAGALIYSRGEALLLSTTGLMLGSMFAFFLGKTFGVKLVRWIIGQEMLDKYYTLIKGRDKALLIFMFILPVFPDDFLCLIAGLTSMRFTAFFIIQIISRPINIIMTAYAVDIIKIIPFSGWGLAVWAILAILFIVVFVFMWKKAELLETKMVGLFNRITGRSSVTIIEWKDEQKKTVIVEEEKTIILKKQVEELEPLELELEVPINKNISDILSARDTDNNIPY